MSLTPRQVDEAVAYNRNRLPALEEMVELVRHWQETHGLDADGKYGPATQESVWAALEVEPTFGAPFDPFDGPLHASPQNRKDVYAIFGNPGAGQVDEAWKKASIVTVRDLPGVPPKWYFECHRLIEPYLREGLRRAKLACPDYQIERAASFVFRHQRHDPKRPLSYHSWGIAVDFDASLNFAKTFAAGTEPDPWSPAWMAIWPKGLPEGFVLAFESVGFVWGGRWKQFKDPMHFEFVGSDVQV